MLYKIKVHSVVNVITNSSSVIYNYYDASVKAAKDMINEFLKALNVEKTADDLFYVECMCDVDHYLEHFDGSDNDEDAEDSEKTDAPSITPTTAEMETLIENIITGKVKKPKWMKEVEEDDGYGDGFPMPNVLYVIPKNKKYKAVAEKIVEFVDSSTQEASYG